MCHYGAFLVDKTTSVIYIAYMANYLSAVQNSSNLSSWDEIVDLRHEAEDAQRAIFGKLIDDRHVLEAKVRLLERKLREVEGSRG